VVVRGAYGVSASARLALLLFGLLPSSTSAVGSRLHVPQFLYVGLGPEAYGPAIAEH
jgi:hypothetical protein